MTVESPHDFLRELRQYPLISAANLDAVERDLGRFGTAIQLADHLIARGWLTRFQATNLLEYNGSQLVLGPYRVLDILGRGGMGWVVKAWSERHNRIVA